MDKELKKLTGMKDLKKDMAKDMMKKMKLPQSVQDTVSPATRLLEKRRLMYEVQEAFEREKQGFTK